MASAREKDDLEMGLLAEDTCPAYRPACGDCPVCRSSNKTTPTAPTPTSQQQPTPASNSPILYGRMQDGFDNWIDSQLRPDLAAIFANFNFRLILRILATAAFHICCIGLWISVWAPGFKWYNRHVVDAYKNPDADNKNVTPMQVVLILLGSVTILFPALIITPLAGFIVLYLSRRVATRVTGGLRPSSSSA